MNHGKLYARRVPRGTRSHTFHITLKYKGTRRDERAKKILHIIPVLLPYHEETLRRLYETVHRYNVMKQRMQLKRDYRNQSTSRCRSTDWPNWVSWVDWPSWPVAWCHNSPPLCSPSRSRWWSGSSASSSEPSSCSIRPLSASSGESWCSSCDGASSSFHLSIERRRAFMKKLPTVVGSRPSCLAMVTCISFEGRFVS